MSGNVQLFNLVNLLPLKEKFSPDALLRKLQGNSYNLTFQVFIVRTHCRLIYSIGKTLYKIVTTNVVYFKKGKHTIKMGDEYYCRVFNCLYRYIAYLLRFKNKRSWKLVLTQSGSLKEIARRIRKQTFLIVNKTNIRQEVLRNQRLNNRQYRVRKTTFRKVNKLCSSTGQKAFRTILVVQTCPTETIAFCTLNIETRFYARKD